MLKKYLTILCGSLILIFLLTIFLQNKYSAVQAQGMGGGGTTSLTCQLQTQYGPDDKEVKIAATPGNAIPIAGNDNYVYDNTIIPETDPEVVMWAGEIQRYSVLETVPTKTWNASQTWMEEGQNLCGTTLQCGTSCKPPVVSGSCDSSCNISVNGTPQCPKYSGTTSFTVTSNAAGTITWGDGGSDTFNPGPTQFPLAHRYNYPGSYDAVMNCGGQICVKRFNVVCQSGGNPGNTPTPLPTASPTPTGVYLCITPLVCSHPCACNTTSSSFVNAGCSISSSAATNLKGGFGTTAGNADGQSCLPGMVCCQAPNTSNAWLKTKDTSYNDKAALSNPIPTNAAAYDVSDTGPCSNPANSYNCHTINLSGLLSVKGNISLGNGVANYPRWSYGNAAYNYTGEFTPDTFIQYMRARKETVTISDPEDVQTNKVNYINGQQTIYEIDNNGMQGKAPFVLLIDNGDLNFDLANQFNPPNAAMAIIVDGTINIKSTISEMNGIFIANRFDFASDIAQGATTTNSLKMNGNVISLNDVDCLAKRKRTDSTKPTCYFTFDFVNQYMPLWNLFSTRTFSRSST